MKFTTFEVETDLGTQRRVGVVDESDLLDVTAGYGRVLADDGAANPQERADVITPSSMLEFLRVGDEAMNAARDVLAADYGYEVRSPNGVRIRYGEADVTVLSPLPRPNTIRDCSVFEDHAADHEKPDVWYDIPTFYKGNPDSIVRPDSMVEWPDWEDKLDFELEVAAVIGTQGRDIDAADAEDYIAGYTIFNDFSARDYQFYEMEMPFGPAKSKDFANAFGPTLVTADEFDADSATVRARVNGEEWMTGTLEDMYHSWGDIIEHASRSETLIPGDVIGCGTVPGGCCLDQDRWVDPGDTVELEVDSIGTLRHQLGTLE